MEFLYSLSHTKILFFNFTCPLSSLPSSTRPVTFHFSLSHRKGPKSVQTHFAPQKNSRNFKLKANWTIKYVWQCSWVNNKLALVNKFPCEMRSGTFKVKFHFQMKQKHSKSKSVVHFYHFLLPKKYFPLTLMTFDTLKLKFAIKLSHDSSKNNVSVIYIKSDSRIIHQSPSSSQFPDNFNINGPSREAKVKKEEEKVCLLLKN